MLKQFSGMKEDGMMKEKWKVEEKSCNYVVSSPLFVGKAQGNNLGTKDPKWTFQIM